MFRTLLFFLIYFVLASPAAAELRVVGVSIKQGPATDTLLLDLLGETPESTYMALVLDNLIEKMEKLESWGSAIFLYIESEEHVAWKHIQKVIDAANRNPFIQIKSIRVGGFIKTHDRVMKELKPNHQMQPTR